MTLSGFPFAFRAASHIPLTRTTHTEFLRTSALQQDYDSMSVLSLPL